ncbi:MAG: radical SAM protein [Oligoflexia bacterium]|nr:radical SAM protein [Oligoflexia bacterium]
MRLVYCDINGNIFDSADHGPALRYGRRFRSLGDAYRNDDLAQQLIPLPFGSYLFSLPHRLPIYYPHHDRGGQSPYQIFRPGKSGEEAWAASAFISSGYLRTYLPAYIRPVVRSTGVVPTLSLWAYSAVFFDSQSEKFFVPAIRIDQDQRSDPQIHQNDEELQKKIEELKKFYPDNRLVGQLAFCASEYRCLCARNFFLSRYEAPIPTSPNCNSRCLGCLSEGHTNVQAPQRRLNFAPTPQEISQVIIHHLQRVEHGVASFGQGCEGEPLLRAKDLEEAIRMVRGNCDHGTININTNGSRPDMIKSLATAGLNSIRISLNSFNPDYYQRYYRPHGYSYSDIINSIEEALAAGLFVSLNLFFLPGFSDSKGEVERLYKFLERYPVSMIQTRNLNIDPDYYLDQIGFKDGEEEGSFGVYRLINMLKRDFPQVRLGYYNPYL